MVESLALIGFGEAGSTFALAAGWQGKASVYDRKTDTPETAQAKYAEYTAAAVRGCVNAAEALSDQPLILSLVTADQAFAVARDCAPLLATGALWCDMNSVAPDTKKAAAAVIEAAGGRYVDVAVMSPVDPARMASPLLLSGPYAQAAEASLRALGFANVRCVGDGVGRASAVKMLRSVIVKGVEALTAECVLAASKAGVVDEVLGSLGAEWVGKADYNLDRMMLHGLRRAAEMEEVVKTLSALGVEPEMTRGTVIRQRAIGSMGLTLVPDGLAAKLKAIETQTNQEGNQAT
jgi:3-hydroxyisobutyrate dehydrogenase-like beta-hydroxyacid dehydrogenase